MAVEFDIYTDYDGTEIDTDWWYDEFDADYYITRRDPERGTVVFGVCNSDAIYWHDKKFTFENSWKGTISEFPDQIIQAYDHDGNLIRRYDPLQEFLF